MDTQRQMIVDYMNEHGSITSLDAIRDIGCTRLAAQINALKKKGYVITDEWDEVKNRYGDTRRVKRYRLGEDG